MNQFRQRIVQLFWALVLPANALAGPITIGVDLGLTDRYPQIATDIRRALLDHAQAVNRSGGLVAGRPLRFEILDNRGVTDRSLEHLQTLQARKDVLAIIGSREAAALEGRVFFAAKPFIVIWGASEGFSPQGPALGTGPHADALRLHEERSFRVTAPISDQISAIVSRMIQERQLLAAMVLSADAKGRLCQDAVGQQLLVSPSLSLVHSERIPVIGIDYSLLVQSLHRAGAEAVIWCARGEQLSEFLNHPSIRTHVARQGFSVKTIYAVATASDVLQKLAPKTTGRLQLRLIQAQAFAASSAKSDIYSQTRALAALLTQAIRESPSLSAEDLSAAFRSHLPAGGQVQLVDYSPSRRGRANDSGVFPVVCSFACKPDCGCRIGPINSFDCRNGDCDFFARRTGD